MTVNIGGAAVDLDSETATPFSFDFLGRLTVIMDAPGLTTPGLRARLDSMSQDTFVVFYPDEQIHHHLMGISVQDVQGVCPTSTSRPPAT